MNSKILLIPFQPIRGNFLWHFMCLGTWPITLRNKRGKFLGDLQLPVKGDGARSKGVLPSFRYQLW